MTTKEIILAGGGISFPYKEKETEYVGTAKMYMFSGGFGMEPHISVEIPTIDLAPGGTKNYELNQIDEAISSFNSIVFRPKNWSYKMSEAMIELYNEGETRLDLGIKEDYVKIKKRQKEKQKAPKIKNSEKQKIPKIKKVDKKKSSDYIYEVCGNCSCDFIRHISEEKHKDSGIYLCGQCKLQW